MTDDSSSSSDDSDSDSDSSSSFDSEDDEPITQEYLDSLLEKARQNATLLAEREDQQDKEDVLVLESSSQPYVTIFRVYTLSSDVLADGYPL